MSEYFAEFLGTAILVLFGGGVCANVNLKKSAGNGADWIVIAAGWGLAVTMGVYAVGNISGAHLNPAVTLAFAMDGGISWAMVPGFIICQMLGGIVGGALVWLMYLAHWKQTEDQGAKLGVFSTAPAIKNYFANFLSEIIGTAILTLGLMFIGTNKIADGLNPLIVGGLIVAIGLSLGGPTGYAINPARDLGPRIAHAILPIAGKGKSNWSYAIVPVLGPITGGMIGAVIYRLFYKGAFDAMSIVAIILLIVTCVLGIALNKSKNAKGIESIY
ncbi:aquaporin family protein [Staphylococcus casei]|uniref:MIP/aquaporin family protein n=1 Tax=Staphylococcus casei TaxID=201828 RepID=A0ABZ2WCI7_9STAP|nr:MIP/aquaporin family protein [Staphylococcus casei]OEL02549.1 glycerol transporter [Staphylococcus succinus]PNZ60263.1 aquaporin family protein [Staphylococcus casei]PTI41754.1 aquaporin family protein [Staphylococcus succinus]PTI80212.1 aquaporin family protein [Staphylococcus succinus]WJE85382.1 MIP/aquaporin family protein [Staphylococcus casei]